MADALIGKLRAIQARLNKGPDDWDGNHAQMEASLRECRYDLADLLPEIVAALERDAQDAARYRGLRDVGDHTFTPMVQRGPHYSTQQIDLRIDAAQPIQPSANPPEPYQAPDDNDWSPCEIYV